MVVTMDEDETFIDVVGLTESPDNVYSGMPSFLAAGLYSLRIVPTGTVTTLADADDWTVSLGSFTSRTDSNFVKTGSSSVTDATTPMPVPNGSKIKFSTTVTISGLTGGFISLFAQLTPNGVNISPTSAQVFTANGTYVIDWMLEASGGAATTLSISVVISGSSKTISIAIENDRDMILSTQDQTIMKSDCLNVKTDHPCSNIVTFTNASSFAGLIYSSMGSPTFSIRVPSVFFHEEPTEEEETHALSNDTFITVWAKLQKKQRFDIDFVPYYFHEKLKLILAHQSVTIDEGSWIKRDPYEIEQGNKRYPLKKGSVMLTQKDYIKRNLL